MCGEAFGGWTALMLAAMNGNLQVVRLLIGKGADINAKSNEALAKVIFVCSV
jgi:ankyrin repeat protein